jgi:uncharacterized protein YoxC
MSTFVTALFGITVLGAIYVGVKHLKGIAMATKDELVTSLTSVNESLTKISAETTSLVEKVQELEERLANVDVQIPDDVMTLVSDLRARVQAVDDLVTDTAPTDPNEPVEPTDPTQPAPTDPNQPV